MLKIRDDVDLKELEKYGFEKISYGYEKKGFLIHKKTRELYTTVYYEDYCDLEPLYDLIKDGLVEKVEQ